MQPDLSLINNAPLVVLGIPDKKRQLNRRNKKKLITCFNKLLYPGFELKIVCFIF